MVQMYMNQPTLYRDEYRRCPVVDLELGKNILKVILYGLFAQVESRRDFFIPQTSCDLVEDFQFARGETSVGDAGGQFLGDFRRNGPMSRVDAANCPDKFDVRRIL